MNCVDPDPKNLCVFFKKRKFASSPHNFMIHVAFSVAESAKMFAKDPDYGRVIESWNSRVPAWQFLEQFRPPWVLYRAMEDTTADPKFFPWRLSYREFWKRLQKILKKAGICQTEEDILLPCSVDTLLSTLDKVIRIQNLHMKHENRVIIKMKKRRYALIM